MIVEDDPASRKYLRLILTHQDYNVIIAVTGEDALEQIASGDVDGMLVDIALGSGISGLDLVVALKQDERFSETPLIAVTAYERDNLGDLDDSGFTGYIQKPYYPHELWEVLKDQLSRETSS